MLKRSQLSSMSSRFAPIRADGNLRWSPTLLLYVVSHGFILAVWNAFFWDDWIYYSNGSGGIRQLQSECTRWCIPLRGWAETQLISVGPWAIRALTFILWPVVTFFLYQFLKRTPWLSRAEGSTVSLLFLLMPINGARVSLITNYYLFSLTLFALGAWMILSPRRLMRLVSLVPLFWSMFTASLQVFVFVLTAILVVRLMQKLDSLNQTNLLVLVLVTTLPFMHRYFLPLIFQSMVITTDGYNTIRPAFLARALFFTFMLLVPLFLALLRIRLKKPVPRENFLCYIGLALIGLGTFPYLAVGHFANLSDWILPFLPDESDWNSRHQLLQAFGLAFVLLGISSMFGVRKRSFIICTVALSIGLNFVTYSGYFLDGMKQREFVSAVHDMEKQLSGVSAVVISDESLRFNARGRWIRSYEWTAMLERATDFAIEADDGRIQNCEVLAATKMLTITASNGRLKSLLTGRVGISVQASDLPTCFFSH